MDVVHVAGLTQRFGSVTALDDLTVSFAENQVTGLLGRNGAGKSTLIDILTGRRPAASGSVRVGDANPYENRHTLRDICGVGEAQRYPQQFSVAAVLDSAALLHPRWDAEMAADLVDTFALRRRQKVAKLSRGQRSALGVTVGLAARAPLTIFDEPYVGLDAVARQTFYDRLLQELVAQPRTVIMSSHLIDEVAHLLERVVVLDRGRVVLDAPVDDVRGTVVEVTGPSVTVNAFTHDQEVLQTRHLGGLTRATVRGADLEAARALGLRVDVLSLQEIVVSLASVETPLPAGPLPAEAVAS